MKKLFVFIFVYLLSYNITFSQPAKSFSLTKPETVGMSSERLSRIDTFLNDCVKKEYIPGAVAFIARKGKIVYYKSFGYDDIEKKIPLKKDQIFRIASQTKAITSIAAIMLYEEGKYNLDDPVQNLFLSLKILLF